MFYFLLSGEFPFPLRNSAEVQAWHVGPPANVSRLPTRWQPLVKKCLARKGSERFRSCEEIRQLMLEIAQRSPAGDQYAARQGNAGYSHSGSLHGEAASQERRELPPPLPAEQNQVSQDLQLKKQPAEGTEAKRQWLIGQIAALRSSLEPVNFVPWYKAKFPIFFPWKWEMPGFVKILAIIAFTILLQIAMWEYGGFIWIPVLFYVKRSSYLAHNRPIEAKIALLELELLKL